MKRIIILFLLVISNSTFAQGYNDFASEIFFGRLPSAKTEAMGRILTLNFDPYFISHSNPANLVTTNGAAVFYAHSSPFYGYNDATYSYIGVSYNNPKIGAFAFNYLNFNSGSTVFIPALGVPFTNPFKEKRYLYTLTYAYKIIDWFSFGINANLFVDDFGTDKTFSDTFFELGLSRDFILIQDSEIKDELTTGTQLKNIFNQSFSAIDEAQSDPFPVIFRIGISNLFEYTDKDFYRSSYLFGFTLGIEYQDLLNADFRTAYKIGGELSLLDIIFLRGGFYHETRGECGNCRGKVEDVTYGFGVKLDFNKHFTTGFPLIILFDFVNLEQPSHLSDFSNWDNFTTLNLIANYSID
ncbi:MAG: hypothetical protein JSW63_01025 [Ignavibacterium sp.]|nr:MAG: hypothetical protein JSW63_01025 [Ignavibacterium sp.]